MKGIIGAFKNTSNNESDETLNNKYKTREMDLKKRDEGPQRILIPESQGYFNAFQNQAGQQRTETYEPTPINNQGAGYMPISSRNNTKITPEALTTNNFTWPAFALVAVILIIFFIHQKDFKKGKKNS